MRRHRLTRWLVGAAVLATLAGTQAAGAASTSKLTVMVIREDAFRNYDFLSQTVSSTNVDWPVNFLFWNNAEIDKVKDAMRFSFVGGPMHARLNDGSGYVWDEDRGRKTYLCPIIGDAHHFRVYADGNDRLYNVAWGYYILATSHIDHNECGLGAWFGKSETAEAYIAGRARTAFGSGNVAEDWSSFANSEPYREEGNHIWQNNGLVTAVRVP